MYRLSAFAISLVCFMLSASPCAAQEFSNAAKDSQEAPYIEKLTAQVDGRELVLRFEGKLRLGREDNARRANIDKTFHHAIHRMLLTLNNDKLDEFVIDIGPDKAGKPVIHPAECSFTSDAGSVTVRVPLSLIAFTPVDLFVETDVLYFGNDDMMATSGRNLFSAEGGKPVRISIAGLPENPDKPAISNLKAVDVDPISAILEWDTSFRSRAQVLLTAGGKDVQTVQQDILSRRHTVTLTGLSPRTEYQAVVTGKDFTGREVPARSISFTTPAQTAAKAGITAWLKVRGKYIVDSNGNPFPLGGYSVSLSDWWWNEFPRFGTIPMAARYFRSLGMNACRLGLGDQDDNYWAAGVFREGGFKRYGGPEGFVKKFVRPMVDQIANEGMYVILDWHDAYKLTDETIEQISQFWEAAAKEFKDEPRIAMFQPMNEPTFPDGECRPEFAERIRNITKAMILRIRKHDKRHIIIVSDWNVGWGWATESQWKPVNFDPGDPQRQIVFSKHIAGQHCNDTFMAGGVDRIADLYNVPLMFDEIQNNEYMSPSETGWFYNYLYRNPRKYGFATAWCGQYWPEFAQLTSAFANAYLPEVPFLRRPQKLIVSWNRADKPEVSKSSDGSVFSVFTMPEKLPAGDYGIVLEEQPPNTQYNVALKPDKNSPRRIGGWLGRPGDALWLPFFEGSRHIDGANMVPMAMYFHALEPFEQVVIKCSERGLQGRPAIEEKFARPSQPKSIQVFRLNPTHQMPVPKVTNLEVWNTVTDHYIGPDN
jgi:hypothetical protein